MNYGEYKQLQRQAHKKVEYAIRKGRIVRPNTCSDCGETEIKVEGHHPDYKEPYNVVWLCHSCHGETHKSPFIGLAYRMWDTEI